MNVRRVMQKITKTSVEDFNSETFEVEPGDALAVSAEFMSDSHPVRLRLYDLSRGMAKAMSMMLIGKQIDGIWHTGIEVYGYEYFFGGNGCNKELPTTVEFQHNMKPVQVLELGNTEIPREVFEEFVQESSNDRFKGSNYDLINNNCNNFSDEAAQFLVGSGIPSHIIDLPREALSTPLGQQLMPFLQSMGAVNPGTAIPSMGGLFGGAPQAAATARATPPPAAAPQAAAAQKYPSIESVLKAIKDDKTITDEQKKNCVATVGKLLSNLAAQPSNPKFAVVNAAVSAIQKHIGGAGNLGFILVDKVGFRAPAGLSLLSFDFTNLSDTKVEFSYDQDLLASPQGLKALADSRDLVQGFAASLSAPASGAPSAPPAANPLAGGASGNLASMAQQMLSDPQARSQAANLLNSNPALGQLASSLFQNLGGGQQAANGMPDLSGLLGMLGGAPQQPQTIPTRTSGAPSMSAEEKAKVEAVQGMGFTDVPKIRQALQAANGDVAQAINILCSM